MVQTGTAPAEGEQAKEDQRPRRATVSWRPDVATVANPATTTSRTSGGATAAAAPARPSLRRPTTAGVVPSTTTPDANAPLPPGAPQPNRYATEIVRSLFPPASSHPRPVSHPVSPVLADHSCAYRSTSGRLYVSVGDVCFYSNLFGRETKIRMELSRVADVRGDGKTGLAIQMMEGEGGVGTYAFKRIERRDEVLKLMKGLYARATGRPVSPPAPLAAAAANGSGNAAASSSSPAVTNPARGSSSVAAPAVGTRDAPETPPRGSSSLTPPSAPGAMASAATDASAGENTPQQEASGAAAGGAGKSSSPARRAAGGRTTHSAADSPATTRTSASSPPGWGWDRMLDSALSDHPLQALENLHLPCSLSVFRDTFLFDFAAHPLSSYMSTIINDTDITTSGWEEGFDDDGLLETRTIQFQHPLNSAFAPSAVKSTKKQVLRRYPGNKGMVMESETTIEGGRSVPAAGRFRVKEVWLIEGGSGGEGEEEAVSLTVRFAVDFDPDVGAIKRVIESRSKSETREWYKGYQTFLLDALSAKSVAEDAEKEPSSKVLVRSPSDVSLERRENRALLDWMGSDGMELFWIAAGAVILLLAAPLAALVFHVWGLTDRVAELEGELAEIRAALNE